MIMTDFAQPLIAPETVALIGVSGDAKNYQRGRCNFASNMALPVKSIL